MGSGQQLPSPVTPLHAYLVYEGVCARALRWVERRRLTTAEAAWAVCTNPDWMVWYLRRRWPRVSHATRQQMHRELIVAVTTVVCERWAPWQLGPVLCQRYRDIIAWATSMCDAPPPAWGIRCADVSDASPLFQAYISTIIAAWPRVLHYRPSDDDPPWEDYFRGLLFSRCVSPTRIADAIQRHVACPPLPHEVTTA